MRCKAMEKSVSLASFGVRAKRFQSVARVQWVQVVGRRPCVPLSVCCMPTADSWSQSLARKDKMQQDGRRGSPCALED